MNAQRTAARRRGVSACTAALIWVCLVGLPGCGGGDDGPGDLPAPVASTNPAKNDVEATAAAPASTAPQDAAAAGAADALRLHIVQAPQDATVETGDVVTFNVRADGPLGLSYQWLRDGDAVDGAIGTSLQVTATEADHLAAFNVDVTAGKLTVRSAAATLRVKPS